MCSYEVQACLSFPSAAAGVHDVVTQCHASAPKSFPFFATRKKFECGGICEDNGKYDWMHRIGLDDTNDDAFAANFKLNLYIQNVLITNVVQNRKLMVLLLYD